MARKNAYKAMLEQEVGKEEAARLIRWARRGYRINDKSGLLSKRDREYMDEVMSLSYQSSEELRAHGLAIVAVASTRCERGQLTANLSDVLGRVFMREFLTDLHITGAIEIFAVAQPYQIVFSLR